MITPLEGSPLGHSKRSCASGSAGRGTADKLKGTGTFSMDTAVKRKVPPGSRSSHSRALPRTDGCEVRSNTSDSRQREVDSAMRADSSREAWRIDRGHVPYGCPNRPRVGTAARCINEPATNPSPDSRPFACSRCSARWKTRAHLNKHVSAVHTHKVFACSQCDLRFKTSSQLKCHQSVHLKDNAKIKPYPCTVCGFRFAKKAHLTVHTYKHTGERPFVCKVCPATFNRSGHLKAHLRKHKGEHPIACSKCTRSFWTEEAHKRHVDQVHEDSARLCPVCGAWFDQVGNLRQHLRIHTGEKPYLCNTCGVAFAQSVSFKTHVRIHTGEKPFRCGECGMCFRQNTSLVSHVHAKHPGCLPWGCGQCPFKCSYKRELNMHVYNTAHKTDTC